MNTPIIEVKNITVIQNNVTILEHVSFEVTKGEVVAVIGPNGAGKTTLLRSLLGVLPLASGNVTIHTDRISYVPQKLDFDRSIPITVREFLDLYSPTKSEECIESFDISSLLDKQIGVLSGGELQRVLFVNAMRRNPELLLLDEPTGGLDVTSEEQFYSLIEEIRTKSPITILMISHDIHHVFSKVDQVLCINKHLCCDGHPSVVTKTKEFVTLFGSHLSPYTHTHDGHTH